MKLTIERADLLAAVTKAATACGSGAQTIAHLTHVLLDVAGRDLSVTGTDMEMRLTVTADCLGHEPGRICVPAADLAAIAKNLPDGSQVEISLGQHGGDQRLLVACGRSRYRLPVLPPDEFPQLQPLGRGVRIQVSAPDFARTLDRVAFAMSSDKSKYYLNGVFFHGCDDHLRLVGLDGHQMARATLAVAEGMEGWAAAVDLGVTVPRAAIALVERLIDKQDGVVELEFSRTAFALRMGRLSFSSKLIDGMFPEYERIVPAGPFRWLSAPREEMAAAVKRVGLATIDRGRAVAIEISGEGMGLSVSDNVKGSLAEDRIDIQADFTLRLGLNAGYLGNALGALDGDRVSCGMTDADSPTVWLPANDADVKEAEHMIIIMPMRV